MAIQLAGYTAPINNGTGNYNLSITSEMVFNMRLQQERSCDGVEYGCSVVPTYDFSCSAGLKGGCPYGSVHQPDKADIGRRAALQLYKHLVASSNTSVLEGPRATKATAQALSEQEYNITVVFGGGSAPFSLRGTRNCTVCCNGTDVTVDLAASVDGKSFVNGTHTTLAAADTSRPSVSFRVKLPGTPRTVRYTSLSIWPQCALYNKEGLSAFPFDIDITDTQAPSVYHL